MRRKFNLFLASNRCFLSISFTMTLLKTVAAAREILYRCYPLVAKFSVLYWYERTPYLYPKKRIRLSQV